MFNHKTKIMKTFKNLLTLMTLIFCLNFATAQEPQAERYENAEWYVISYLKFENGKIDEAKQVINEYFKPASEEAGEDIPVLELDLFFSEWDYIAVFPLQDGLEALEWKRSPGDVAMMKALMKRLGSPEKLQELGDRFTSYIKESKSVLAKTSE